MASRVYIPPRIETGTKTEYMEHPPTYNLIYTGGPSGIKGTSEHRHPMQAATDTHVTTICHQLKPRWISMHLIHIIEAVVDLSLWYPSKLRILLE